MVTRHSWVTVAHVKGGDVTKWGQFEGITKKIHPRDFGLAPSQKVAPTPLLFSYTHFTPLLCNKFFEIIDFEKKIFFWSPIFSVAELGVRDRAY